MELWKNLMDNAMSANFSWERSAKAYFDLYQRLTGRRDKTLGNR
jgi:glycogen synthase